MTSQVLSLPWISVHRRRNSGAPGLPATLGLQSGEIVANEADIGGATLYYGAGNDGNGNATSQVPIAGPGAFIWKGRTAIADASYTILRTDTLVAMTALTQTRTITLPAAASYDPRQPLIILDESGAVSGAMLINIVCAGADVIVTGGNVTSASLGSPGQKTVWHTDGVGKWTYA